ncbi:MAG: metallophosphoesterase family protein [bacterium]
MRYGVFADIHSNIDAFEVVLNYFEKEKIHQLICSGDIVGYGPNPNECIKRIRNLKNLVIVAGNHDKAVVGMKDTRWFNDFAARAILWTKRQLDCSNHGYLTKLHNTIDQSQFFVVHGSPRDPLDEYMLAPTQFQDAVTFYSSPVCFVGHTHVPNCFTYDSLKRIKIKSPMSKDTIKIEQDAQVMYNPGSVGQSRDGDPRASCAVYDTSNKTIKLVRLEYDIKSVQSKMRKAQLPLYLIERLSTGR